MANTYTQIYIMVVFSVSGRPNLIGTRWKDELYKYTTGIIKSQNQKLIVINGVGDHIHILIGLKPDIALSDLVRVIKANSSKFINKKKFVRGKFNWQEGFEAFSYSYSQLSSVIKYIENQEKHHKKKTFKEEYSLEYGNATIEIHKDAITKDQKVLIVDDLIATGGSCIATINLIKKLEGNIVECAFVIELPALKGRDNIEKQGYKVYSLVQFEGE